MVFTDEARVEMKPRLREYVRRPLGGSFTVWGAIKANGDRMLFKCQGMVDSVEYQRILGVSLLPALNRNEIFQQDGTPCHRSASTQTYLDSK